MLLIILARANTVTTVTGSLDNRGTITGATAAKLIFNAGTYLHGQNGGTVPLAAWNTGSQLHLNGMTTAYPANMNQNFRSVVFNGNLTADVIMGVDLTCLEDLTINLTFTAGSDLILNAANPNRTVDVGRHFNLVAGTFSLDNGNGGSVLNIGGNFDQTGGTLTEGGGGAGTVNFNNTAVHSFSKTGGTISQNVNFNINANEVVDFGTSVLDGTTGNFSLADAGKIITSNASGLSSSGATGSIQVGGLRVFGSIADYEFRGATTGTFTTTANQVRNLVINNTTTDEVLAQRNFVVTGALTLTNGYLTTSPGQLTLDVLATASTSNGSFVNGPMAKNTNSAASFTFPVGKVAGGLRTIGIITSAATASTFTAEFFRGISPTGTLAPTITQVSACEYWDLSRPAGSPAQVILSWETTSPCNTHAYVTQLVSLRVAHLMGGVWSDEGYSSSTGTPSAGTVTSLNAVTSFSPFTLASSTGSENPLPVTFADVKAYEKDNGVQIEWSNLTEKDVAVYSIERSSNGIDYAAISQQLPTSNQNDKAAYQAFDATVPLGISYYRIKAVETTGKIVYSKVLTINISSVTTGLKVYPNPVKGRQVTVNISDLKAGQYTLRVINTVGQDIYRQTINSLGSTLTQSIELPSSIKPGVYNIIMAGNNYRQSQSFIVQ